MSSPLLIFSAGFLAFSIFLLSLEMSSWDTQREQLLSNNSNEKKFVLCLCVTVNTGNSLKAKMLVDWTTMSGWMHSVRHYRLCWQLVDLQNELLMQGEQHKAFILKCILICV